MRKRNGVVVLVWCAAIAAAGWFLLDVLPFLAFVRAFFNR